MERLERVAGVEPLLTSLPGVPPAHDTQYPPDTAYERFCQHWFDCFFCHVGDRYTEDHMCEEGRDLFVAMLDERKEAELLAGQIAESRLLT